MKTSWVIMCFALAAQWGTAFAGDAGTLHLTPLHIAFPEGWTFDGNKEPVQGHGPDGETVLVTKMRKRATDQPDAPPTFKETTEHMARGPVAMLATRGGKTVIRPVGPFPVSEGKAGYSVGSEVSRTFGGKYYFLQYVLADPVSVIYITVEGKGEALPAMQKFDAILTTQRWDN